MRTIFVIFWSFFLATITFAAEMHPVITSNPEIALKINSNPKATWTAAHYPGMLFPPALIHAVNSTEGERLITGPSSARAALPESFDAESNWPNCKFPVRSQGNCGSCWAFSATMILQTRMCMKGVTPNTWVLSPQELVSCDTVNNGCNGGWTNQLFSYASTTGILSESCYPYGNANLQSTLQCTLNGNTCPAGASKKFLRFTSSRDLRIYKSVTAMQEEIMKNGPIATYMDVYQEFYNYRSGVYSLIDSSSKPGGHLVVITGWGVEGGVPYWLVKNSWGSTWGLDGYFKIARGRNEVNIETYVYTVAANSTYFDELIGSSANPQKSAMNSIQFFCMILIPAIIISLFSNLF